MNAVELYSEWADLWIPPDRLSLSEWAQRNFVLSEYSASPGKLLELYGWQKEIFDSFTDPRVQEIVLKVGTQLIKTLFIQAATAYVVSCAPGPILIAQPKESDAEHFSKERLTPMIRDNEGLGRLFGQNKGAKSSDTTVFKSFPGGSLSLVGAQSAANAARRTIQYSFCDEVNKYPPSIDGEGSFLSLVDERTAPFRSRAKRIYCCSPTIPSGAISLKYEQTDQRRPWAPCKYCGFAQILNFRTGVKFDDTGTIEERARTARYECANPGCRKPWDDNDRWKSADAAEWRAERPFWGKAGFWLNHLYSMDKTLSQIVLKFLVATTTQNLEEERVFINTNLAEEYVDKGESPEWQMLVNRREEYQPGVVPPGGLFITIGADVHPDRIEAEAVAWGRDKQSWSVAYEIFNGRTNEPGVWMQFEAFTQRLFPHALNQGVFLQARRVFVDSGNSTNEVYNWVRTQDDDLVTAVKGYDGGASPVGQPSPVDVTVNGRKVKDGLKIKTIQVSYFKAGFYSDLKKQPPTEEELERGFKFPPGYCHFPKGRNYGDEHFKQVCAEQKVTRKHPRTGRTITEWQQLRDRNEALDCRIYARGAAWDFGMDQAHGIHWNALEDSLKPQQQVIEFDTSASVPALSEVDSPSQAQVREHGIAEPAIEDQQQPVWSEPMRARNRWIDRREGWFS